MPDLAIVITATKESLIDKNQLVTESDRELNQHLTESEIERRYVES